MRLWPESRGLYRQDVDAQELFSWDLRCVLLGTTPLGSLVHSNIANNDLQVFFLVGHALSTVEVPSVYCTRNSPFRVDLQEKLC